MKLKLFIFTFILLFYNIYAFNGSGYGIYLKSYEGCLKYSSVSNNNVLFFNNCHKPILFPNEFIDQYNTSNYNYVYHNCVSATIQE